MVEQIDALTRRIEHLDQDVLASVKPDDTARRLTSIPGVGPLIAATVRATISDVTGFKSSRDFAAWMGLKPKLSSSGGKDKLGSISKQGNRQLRTLLVVGASSIIKQARRGVVLPEWLVGLMTRKSYKLVAVALASCQQDGPHHLGLAHQGGHVSATEPGRCRIVSYSGGGSRRFVAQVPRSDEPRGYHPDRGYAA